MCSLLVPTLQTNMIPDSLMPSSGIVDIFTVHTRLNPPEHKKILHEDSLYVTIVREPSYLFESLYSYYNLKNMYNMSLEAFLSQTLEVSVYSMTLEAFLKPNSGGKCLKNDTGSIPLAKLLR